MNENLATLRSSILNDLSDISDKLASNENVGYDALLAIAHMTENPALLQAAYTKVKAIEDEDTRTNALLELLDEVDLQLTEYTDDAQVSDSAQEGNSSDQS